MSRRRRVAADREVSTRARAQANGACSSATILQSLERSCALVLAGANHLTQSIKLNGPIVSQVLSDCHDTLASLALLEVQP